MQASRQKDREFEISWKMKHFKNMDINSNFFEIGPYFIFQIFNCGQAIVNCAHNTNENNICLEPTSPQKSQLYFFLLCYLSFKKQYFVCCEFFSSKVKVAQHFSLNKRKVVCQNIFKAWWKSSEKLIKKNNLFWQL